MYFKGTNFYIRDGGNQQIGSKIHMAMQRIKNSNGNLKKKSKSGTSKPPDTKFYHKSIRIKTVWYIHKNSQVDQ